jgi:hypothetical protein
MRRKPHRALLLLATITTLLASSSSFAQAGGVQRIIDAEARRVRQAQEDQQEINAVVDQTRSAFDNYQRVLKDINTLEVYNAVQQRLVDDQNRDLDQLRDSIDQVSVIERQVTPLMTRMIAGLDAFIDLDMPFLLEERKARVKFLNDLVDRSDVTVAEKFRNVMEAWQIENDYGTFSESYSGQLEVNGTMRQVDFLKIGRVALLYLTPDGPIAGAWDKRTGTWTSPLDSDLRAAIAEGIDIVKTGSAAAEMFLVPITPPEE